MIQPKLSTLHHKEDAVSRDLKTSFQALWLQPDNGSEGRLETSDI
jgi:hypothetical protein